MSSLAEELDEEASSTLSSSSEDDFVWEWQTNDDPWDRSQTPSWTPYPYIVATAIENAKKHHLTEISVSNKYRIDLTRDIQQHKVYPERRRPVRRRSVHLSEARSTANESAAETLRGDRLSSPLGPPVWCSNATQDITVYGSPFIQDWFMEFSKGEMKVKFKAIFPALQEGLIKEAQNNQSTEVSKIQTELNETKEIALQKTSKKRMAQLRLCCARIYTEEWCIYSVVNSTLRNNDRTKLHTLGPFCYLLFNYIGSKSEKNRSISDRLHKIFRPNRTRSMTFYRGDGINDDCLEEFRQAAGDNSKQFKWLPFISTSTDLNTAKQFLINVLYIIEIQSYSTHEDRFTNLSAVSKYVREKEFLFLPGVQFQVTKVEFDSEEDIHRIYIKISSSYTSRLQ